MDINDRILSFGPETDPTEVGLSRAGIDRLAHLFEHQFADGLHSAAQLVVARHGRVVLDRTIGVCKLGGYQSVRPSTPFLTFSCTKPLTAVCVHQLVEAGEVDLDRPIADYWPEFGRRGKETATVRHALIHQAGIPYRGLYPQIPHWWHWERVTRNVANLAAEYAPGTETAYHTVNYGFILGELVRRVSGLRIDAYMKKHIFDPLGMENAYLGLPYEELDRAADLHWGYADQRSTVLLFRRARHAVIPAATLNCSARDLAIFYQMMLNGGQYNGQRILQPQTTRTITQTAVEGIDGTIGMYVRWALGFSVGGPKPADAPNLGSSTGRQSTLRTFGHAGQRSSNAWADWDRQMSMVFTCNRLVGERASVMRWQNLSDALWAAVES